MSRITVPPRRLNSKGTIRRVGVELEFGDLSAERAAGVVRKVFGGTASRLDRHAFEITGSRIGRIVIELDARWAHPDFLREVGPDLPEELLELVPDLHERAGAMIGDLLENFLPVEVVMPPIPFEDLGSLVTLRRALKKAGAVGTAKSIFGGFGLHLNVEAASLDASYLTRILRAYLMLSPWLRLKARVDFIRQMGPFIDPFPKRYMRKVIDPDYAPDFETLLTDYLDDNPTRNREMDLLPILTTVDEQAVRARLPHEKIRPRPAFHYRLPSCRLDERDWDPLQDWDRWIVVERLAENDAALDEAARAWFDHGRVPHGMLRDITGEAA